MPSPGVVLVPIRSFADPKTRLADSLTPDERRRLTVGLAAGVLAALEAWPVAVVSDDDEVAAWARTLGAEVHAPAVSGLNPSVAAAAAAATEDGAAWVAVVHADLARPAALGEVLAAATADAPAPAVTAVPDRHDDGTNVLVVPTGTGFTFRYGPGSFAAHRAEAERVGLAFTAARVEDLGWDVDVDADLPPGPATWAEQPRPNGTTDVQGGGSGDRFSPHGRSPEAT